MPAECDGANEVSVSGNTSSRRSGDFFLSPPEVPSERTVNLFSDSLTLCRSAP